MRRLTIEDGEAAVLGGALLGGGGGGDPEAGLSMLRLALEVGTPLLATVDELGEDTTVVTASAVGAPAAQDKFAKPVHYSRAVERLIDAGIDVGGLITSENGGLASINGWFQSAVLDIPVVDAAGNGRAHPMGLMGSMGLQKVADYETHQACAGGDPEKGRNIEMVVQGNLNTVSQLVRHAAVLAGGFVAVARNPVSADYLSDNAAVGAIDYAMRVGRVLKESRTRGGETSAEAAAGFFERASVFRGKAESVELRTVEGFDVGTVVLADGEARRELTFWNEYMTLDEADERLATFPDLIATMDAKTGMPVPTSHVVEGAELTLLIAPAAELPLGAGMRDPSLFEYIERAVQKEIVSYVFGGGR